MSNCKNRGGGGANERARKRGKRRRKQTGRTNWSMKRAVVMCSYLVSLSIMFHPQGFNTLKAVADQCHGAFGSGFAQSMNQYIRIACRKAEKGQKWPRGERRVGCGGSTGGERESNIRI